MNPILLTPEELARELASEGERWLDDHREGWDRDIDVNYLEMSDPKYCILGQTYGSYFFAPPEARERPFDKGFDIGGVHGMTYDLLNDAWHSILAARKL